MKIEITEKKENLLQERTEVRFTVDHTGEATPTRKAVIDAIAKMTNAGKDTVVINNIDTQYGRGISKGYVKVYASKEAALKYEREYLLKRSGIEKDKEAPVETPAEAPAVAEVPAEIPVETPVEEAPVAEAPEEVVEAPAPAEIPAEAPEEAPAEETLVEETAEEAVEEAKAEETPEEE